MAAWAGRPWTGADRRTSGDSFQQRVEQGPVVGKLTGLELRIERLAIDGHFEATATGGHEFQGGRPLLEVFEQESRQTDGSRLVVSDGAVLDPDLHGASKARS